ncbi:hypothetical protein AB6735_19395 [Mucilaginibacter sp. RCC_168]|uniref:hypothetical protein n=1 Tax=Mucilaginibacter sp. RCC_168 TaxID=3239221 RepID=UPI003525B48D
MDIKYLIQLKNHPTIKEKSTDYVNKLKPLTEAEIVSLEVRYNDEKTFPAALRELLYLAGNDCYVLDYGLSDSQEEMQEDGRKWLVKHNKTINRPFFVIDVYNGSNQFLFVYLDEGDDPLVYEAVLYDKTTGWIHCLNNNVQLSEFIDNQLLRLLSDQNPF